MLLLLLCATSEDNLDGLPSLILSMALVLWKSLLEILLIRDMDSHPVFFNDHWQFQTLISCSSWSVISQLWSWLSSLGQLTNLSECTPPTWLHTPYFHQASMTKEPIGVLCYALDILYISIFKLSLLRSPKGYLLHSLKHFMHLHVILWTRLLSSWPSPMGYMTAALGLWLAPL